MGAPLAGSDLDAYRDEADRFIAALDEEFYLHFAGHKATLEVASIYERYADLTTLEQAERLAATAAESPELTELWRFACEGYLGALTREQAEKVANLEASLTTEVDGETIGFRELRPRMANEPDRERALAARDRARRAHRGAPAPALPRGGRGAPRGDRPPRLVDLP